VRVDGHTFLAFALTHQGRPYIYGAKGPDAFDCSGLITYVLWQLGAADWRFQGGSAAHLWDKLPAYEVPELAQGGVADAPAGTLAFYESPAHKVEHVMLCVGDGRVYGATGGGKGTTTPERGAEVQFKPYVRYRSGFLGYRQLPEALHG
jgi:cell wall-associated NlpC family hydrolase